LFLCKNNPTFPRANVELLDQSTVLTPAVEALAVGQSFENRLVFPVNGSNLGELVNQVRGHSGRT
jgi:hypothetical protein